MYSQQNLNDAHRHLQDALTALARAATAGEVADADKVLDAATLLTRTMVLIIEAAHPPTNFKTSAADRRVAPMRH